MSRHNKDPFLFGSRAAHDTTPRCRKSPCFRSTSDGRIALNPDWDKLLSGASKLPKVSLQTRHNFARLATSAPLGSLLTPNDDNPVKAALTCQRANWHRVWARIGFCPCCQSPGRVEIYNHHGLDVIQICAPTDYAIDDWAQYIGQNHTASVPTSETEYHDRSSTFPTIPGDAVLVANTGQSLPNLFNLILQEGIPIEATLNSGASRHSQLMILRSVSLPNGLLTLHAKGSHAQIALPAVRALAVNERAGRWELHAVGADYARLFTFCAHPTRDEDWDAALHTIFPKPR